MRILWNWHVQFIYFFLLLLSFSLFFSSQTLLWLLTKTKFAAINGLGNKYDGRVPLQRNLNRFYIFFSLFLLLYSPLSEWISECICFCLCRIKSRKKERVHKLLLSLENVSFFIFSTPLRFGCHKLRWRLFFSFSLYLLSHRRSIVPWTICI